MSLSHEQVVELAKAALDPMVEIQSPRRAHCLLQIRYEGEVVAKQRPRGNQHYTPKKTRDFEAAVAKTGALQMWQQGAFGPVAYPLTVNLLIKIAAPKSWPDWKIRLAEAGMFFVTQKDLDNMEKAIMDGLNNVVFKDDKQIVKVEKEQSVGNSAGFVATFKPIGLTKNETDRIERVVRKIRKGEPY
jgi:Holliday junction resolvase RusA-like endonuclease